MPAELKASLAHRVIPGARTWVALGHVGGMGGKLIGDDAGLDVIAVGQPQVLLRGDVAQHGRTTHGDVRRANGGGDVVIARGNIGDQRAQRVEGRIGGPVLLELVVFLNHVERHVPRAFHHDLDVVLPGAPGELTDGLELGELGGVVGIR